MKSLLDVPATAELLETLGVPVLGWRTDELPLFYAARGGPPVSARVESAEEAARIAAAHWELGGGGLLLGRPPDESLDDVEPLIEQALAEAETAGVRGQAVTPFVLAYLHRESGGRTLAANRELVVGNARLAGEIAPRAAAIEETARDAAASATIERELVPAAEREPVEAAPPRDERRALEPRERREAAAPRRLSASAIGDAGTGGAAGAARPRACPRITGVELREARRRRPASARRLAVLARPSPASSPA